MMSWLFDQRIFTEAGVMEETDLQLDDGRSLHVYDTGAGPSLTVFWHHGTPNIGAPPEPLFAASERLAPYDADGLDWFAGMADSGVASLRAAAAGRETKERHEAEHGDEYDPEFTPTDMTALSGSWTWVLDVMRPAAAQGPAPAIDDDLAYVGRWGFDPSQVHAPVLFVHGGLDRVVPASHSQWLAQRCPAAEHRLFPDDGHVSILTQAEGALEWLTEHARG